MILIRLYCCAFTLAVISITGASAQDRKPLFPQVIPQPTGQNGYEELVQAVDVLETSRLFTAAESTSTLAEKRRVLAERPVRQALELIREGLAKPVLSPRSLLKIDTLLPELSGFRRLARLLVMQQYVLLADGKVQEALQVATLCLRLGEAIQTDTLISGLVGIAVSSLGIRALGGHLDQLSAADCEALYRLSLAWHAQPDPEMRVMAGERRFAAHSLQDLVERFRKNGPAGLGEVIDLEENDADRRQAAADFVALTPEQFEAMARDGLRLLDRTHEQVARELQKPYWERDFERLEREFPAEPGPLGTLIRMLVPTFGTVSNAYARETASVRLLGCHAAIRRYRWEHGRLPATLPELNLGEMAIDPFTGQPLHYRITGRRFTLSSVGPIATDDNPNAIDGRVPLDIAP
jgi:hypothetical protein